MDGLREQILVNQFVMAAGCPPEQAKKYLQASQWQYEVSYLYLVTIINDYMDKNP